MASGTMNKPNFIHDKTQCLSWGSYTGTVNLQHPLKTNRLILARFGSSGTYKMFFLWDGTSGDFSAINTSSGAIQIKIVSSTQIEVAGAGMSANPLRDIVMWELLLG